jgi:hypothetical protein
MDAAFCVAALEEAIDRYGKPVSKNRGHVRGRVRTKNFWNSIIAPQMGLPLAISRTLKEQWTAESQIFFM